VVREETETGFPVTIKTPSDSIEVSVEENDTVLHLKQKIAKKTSFAASTTSLLAPKCTLFAPVDF
jgi:Ubiquitin family